jgi:hypothetical protein
MLDFDLIRARTDFEQHLIRAFGQLGAFFRDQRRSNDILRASSCRQLLLQNF